MLEKKQAPPITDLMHSLPTDLPSGKIVACTSEQKAIRLVLGTQIGHGNFGAVYQILSINGQKQSENSAFVLKIGKIGEHEVCAMQKMHGQSDASSVVIEAKGASTEAALFRFYQGKNFRDLLNEQGLNDLSYFELLLVMQELLLQVKSLHDAGMAHLDLKPENIILNMLYFLGEEVSQSQNHESSNKCVRIIDGGLALSEGTQISNFLFGTFPYVAPEQLEGTATRISKKQDWFALGCTFAELFGDGPPERKLCMPDAFKNIFLDPNFIVSRSSGKPVEAKLRPRSVVIYTEGETHYCLYKSSVGSVVTMELPEEIAQAINSPWSDIRFTLCTKPQSKPIYERIWQEETKAEAKVQISTDHVSKFRSPETLRSSRETTLAVIKGLSAINPEERMSIDDALQRLNPLIESSIPESIRQYKELVNETVDSLQNYCNKNLGSSPEKRQKIEQTIKTLQKESSNLEKYKYKFEQKATTTREKIITARKFKKSCEAILYAIEVCAAEKEVKKLRLGTKKILNFLTLPFALLVGKKDGFFQPKSSILLQRAKGKFEKSFCLGG